MSGLRGRRRRLPDQALRLRRAAGARRGAGCAARTRDGRQTTLAVGDLEMDLLARAGEARRPGDRPAAARVPAARIPDAPRRPGGDPHHAAREASGTITSIRRPTSSTCTSAACAQKIDKGFADAAAAHRARRRILPACALTRLSPHHDLPAGAALCRAVQPVGRRALRRSSTGRRRSLVDRAAPATIVAEIERPAPSYEERGLLGAARAQRRDPRAEPDRVGDGIYLLVDPTLAPIAGNLSTLAGRSPRATGGLARVPGRARAVRAIARRVHGARARMSSLPAATGCWSGATSHAERAHCSIAIIAGARLVAARHAGLGLARRPAPEPQHAAAASRRSTAAAERIMRRRA